MAFLLASTCVTEAPHEAACKDAKPEYPNKLRILGWRHLWITPIKNSRL